MQNIIQFNKRKRQQMLKSMIQTQQSLAVTSKQMLKARGDADLFKRKTWNNEQR